MLSRNSKFTKQFEMGLQSEDSHMIFEEFDV